MVRVLLLLVAVVAGAAEPDGVLLLRTIAQVQDSIRRVPNYTCVQTVTRNYYAPLARQLPRACELVMRERQHPTLDKVLQLTMRNRLRLDVTLTKSGEIYSWVGASRFDDIGIHHLVREGPIGSGAFGAFLSTIFNGDAKGFTFERPVTRDLRTLMEYSFRVPRPDSHYKVKVGYGEDWAYTGYAGTLMVDPNTGDLVRLTVESDLLPEAAGSCVSMSTLDYTMARIGDGEFLLPKNAVQRWVRQDGEEVENTTSFSDCHEYRGESTITFEGEPVAKGAGTKAFVTSEEHRIPAGLPFRLELTAAIDAETAAAGDRFSARLMGPLRDSQGKTLARDGAVVEGRILRVETHFRPEAGILVVLRPDTVTIRGENVGVWGTRDWRRTIAQTKGKGGVRIDLPIAGEEHAGVFRFGGNTTVLKRGTPSEWVTAK